MVRGPLWAATGTGLVGIGMGLNQNTYTVAAQSVVDWSQRGTATAIISLMRMLGQTVGTAIYGAVVNLTLAGMLGDNAVDRILDPDLRDKLSASEVAPVMAGIGDAVQNVYWVAGAFRCLYLYLYRVAHSISTCQKRILIGFLGDVERYHVAQLYFVACALGKYNILSRVCGGL